MEQRIRVKGVRRKQVDDDKLAYAFLLLAKTMIDNAEELANRDQPSKTSPKLDEEAA